MSALRSPLALVFGAWGLSRAVVVAAFIAAHAFPSALGHWDGAWYGGIATRGYVGGADGVRSDLAFFPLFPFLAGGLERFHVSWPLAGAIVNNLAFLGALFVVQHYVRRKFGERSSQWAVVLLCALPPALFTVVAYSEGCYFLLSACALVAFERRAYAAAAVFGALASATRSMGIVLAAAFAVTAIARKSKGAAGAAAASLLGAAAFAAFCRLRFGDAFAFVHAQRAWRHGAGFDWPAWFALLQHGFRRDAILLHLLALAFIAIALRLRRNLATSAIAATVAAAAWAMAFAYDSMTVFFVTIAFAALLAGRRQLGVTNVAYGIGAIAVVALSGTPFSVDRNLYAVLPFTLALASWFAQVPALGVGVICASLPALALDAMAFARWQWVA